MTENLKVGDKIKVVELMKNDPSPIPIGTTGAIIGITLGLDGNIMQVQVKWDIKRSLHLSFPEDANIFVIEKPKTKFTLYITRDASITYEATIEEESLEAAMAKMSKNGYIDTGVKWTEVDSHNYDNCTFAELHSGEDDVEDEGMLASWSDGDGWTVEEPSE